MIDRPRIPVSTYRFQFHHAFTFEDAERLVPYLDDLGITTLYASPYLKARPGSPHGYDISDHASLNPEIGDDAAHAAMSQALRDHGMGQILDIVPNHMGIGEASNRWWMDVLEHGPSSPFAHYFDIDWHPLTPELEGRVLLPILGDTFGTVLESGALAVHREGGEIHARYYEHRLPLSPRSLAPLLWEAAARMPTGAGEESQLELESIAMSLENLPPRHYRDAEAAQRRHRERAVATRRLAELVDSGPGVAGAVDGAIDLWNGEPGEPSSYDRLEALLDDQPYRLAYWRVAAEEINYRRFFDINDLAGVRVEEEDVFLDTHRLVLDLAAAGRLDGLRIDHPDGLYDPEGYLHRLRDAFRERAGRQPYLLVEKILTGEETVPEGWPVSGTVGYEALDRIGKIFVEEEHLDELTRIYRGRTARAEPFHDLAYRKKRLALRTSLASELTVLSHLLAQIALQDRHTRDFTRASLTEVLAETIACFPVYRTYINAEAGEVSERDRRYADRALREARRRNPSMSRNVFAFLEDTLLLRWPGDLSPATRAQRARFVMKFQQLTGPIMAKGVEDTTFYVYNRLVSLNEVGGEPAEIGDAVGGFHHFCRRRAEIEPHAMTCTSTHDTKRSEDVRARIHVLSEIPGRWEKAVDRWYRLNEPHRVNLDGGLCPDPNDEYLLYQTLLGAWPVDGGEEPPPETFRERIAAYMEKATREAKERTSWVNPDEEYDAALRTFIFGILDSEAASAFIDEIRAFARDIDAAGMLNSLAQLVLKLTMPGVPDIYRGQELWDQSLVDPDNRRPVDYSRRTSVMSEIEEASPAEMLRDWRDGRVKMWVTRQLLRLRRTRPRLFLEGDYRPLEIVGEAARHAIAFARSTGQERLIVVVPRLTVSLTGDLPSRSPTAEDWGDTRIGSGRTGPLRNVLSGGRVDAAAEGLRVADLLDVFPLAVLTSEE